jgi:HK97 family phage major capsid protein
MRLARDASRVKAIDQASHRQFIPYPGRPNNNPEKDMRTLSVIREAKAAKVAEARSIVGKAETEKRSLSAEESGSFDKIKGEIEALEAEEQRAQFLAEQERRSAGVVIAGDGMDTFANMEQRVSLVEAIRCQIEGRAPTGAVAEYSAEIEKRTGVRGVHVPLRTFEKRTQTTTTAAGIVPEDFRADQFVGPLRNSLIVQKLGVRTLTNLRGDVVIPRHASGMTAGWIAEGESLSESGMTFDNITLKPRHVGALTELSRQLVQQSSPDIEQLVRDDMSAIIAEAFDAAILSGDGVKEPLGLLNTAGVQTGGIPATWADILALLEKLELVNVSPNAWLTNPTVAKALRGTLKSASAGADYLWAAGRMAEVPAYATNQTPADTLILGDFTQIIAGVWESVQITVNPFANPAFARGGVYVRALMTADVAVRRPRAFVVASAP